MEWYSYMDYAGNIVDRSEEFSGSNESMLLKSFFFALLKKHIYPNIDPALENILNSITSEIQRLGETEKSIELMKCHSFIESSKVNIHEKFETFLEDPISKESQKSTLSLMDERTLEIKLLNQLSSQLLIIGDGTQVLLRITERLRDENISNYMISPEHICSSFGKIVFDMTPMIEAEEVVLNAFSQSLQKHTLLMWQEAEQYLADNGYKLKSPNEIILNKSEKTKSADSNMMNADLIEKITKLVLSKVKGGLNEKREPDFISKIESNDSSAKSDLVDKLSIMQLEIVGSIENVDDIDQVISDMLKVNDIDKKISRKDRDVINFVGMLFELLLDNDKLKNKIKNVLGFLHIPILKLALLDETFLRDKSHPARCLLHEIFSIIGTCDSGLLESDQTFLLIQDVVKMIVDDSECNDIFISCLAYFKQSLLAIHKEENHAIKDLDCISSPVSTNYQFDDSSYEESILNDDRGCCDEDNDEDQKERFGIDDSAEEIILESCSESNMHAFTESCKSKYSTGSLNLVDGISVGQWVEFIGSSKKTLRCQLVSFNKVKDCYVFTNSSGMKVAEKNSEAINEELTNGTLRVIIDSSLADNKLQTVINKFLRF